MAIKHSPGCGCCGECFVRGWNITDHASGVVDDPPGGLTFDEPTGLYSIDKPIPCDEFLVTLQLPFDWATQPGESVFLEFYFKENEDIDVFFATEIDKPIEEDVDIPAGVTDAGDILDAIQIGGLTRSVVWPPERTTDEEASFPHRRLYTRSRGTAGDILHSYTDTIEVNGNQINPISRAITKYTGSTSGPIASGRLGAGVFRVRRRTIEFSGGCPINKSPVQIVGPNIVVPLPAHSQDVHIRFRGGSDLIGLNVTEIYDHEKNLRVECLDVGVTQSHSPSFAGLNLQLDSATFGGGDATGPQAQLIHTDQSGVPLDNNVARVTAAFDLKPEYVVDSQYTADVAFICAAKFEYPYTEAWKGYDYVKTWVLFQTPFGATAPGNRLYWWDTTAWAYEGQTSVPLVDEELTHEEIDEIAPNLTGGEYWYRVNRRYYSVDENGNNAQRQFADFAPILPKLRFLAQASVGFGSSVNYRKILAGFTSDADLTIEVTGSDFISTELDGSPTIDWLQIGFATVAEVVSAASIAMTWTLNDGEP